MKLLYCSSDKTIPYGDDDSDGGLALNDPLPVDNSLAVDDGSDEVLDLSKGLPPALASLFSPQHSQPTTQPSTPSLQTSFTAHQQNQLASLLTAQGFSLGSMDAAPVVDAGKGAKVVVDKPVQVPPEFQGIPLECADSSRVKMFDPSIELDQLKGTLIYM